MEDRNNQLIKNTIILGVGQLVPKILALAILPILTTHLSTSEYGVYDFILSIADLLIPIITIQIQQAVFRYLLSAKEKAEKSEYISASINYVLISSAIVSIIAYVFLRSNGHNSLFSLVVCIFFSIQALYNLLGQIVRGLGYNLKYTISVIVYSIANFICIIVFVVVLNESILGALLSLALAFLFTCFFMITTSSIWRYYKPSFFDKKALKQLVSFSLPIVPSSIALWVVNLSDRLVIIHYLGEAANGIYGVSNKIPVIYNTAYSVFNLAWTETATRVYEDENPDEYYSTLFNALFKFLIGGMLLLVSITPVIFRLLVNQSFQESLLQVPILYIGAFFNSFVSFYSGIYIALKKTKQVGISSAMGAIINLAINLIFVKYIGLFAASISTAVSFCVIAVFRAINLNKYIKIQYKTTDLIIGFVCFLLLVMIFYLNNHVGMIISICIAISYNVAFNRAILTSLIKKVCALCKR